MSGAALGIHFDFNTLVTAIQRTHIICAARASQAVNVSLTMRNWIIGWYIREYERKGADRTTCGEGLLNTLAERLKGAGVGPMDACYCADSGFST